MNQTQLNDLIKNKAVAKIILQINSVKDLEEYFPIYCFHDLKFIVDKLYTKLDMTDFVNYVTSHYHEDPKNMNIVLGMLMNKGINYKKIDKNKFWSIYDKFDKNQMLHYINSKDQLKIMIENAPIIDFNIIKLLVDNKWDLFDFIIEKNQIVLVDALKDYAKLVPLDFLLYVVKDKKINTKLLEHLLVHNRVIDHVIKNCYLQLCYIIFRDKKEYAEYLIDKIIEIGSCEWKFKDEEDCEFVENQKLYYDCRPFYERDKYEKVKKSTTIQYNILDPDSYDIKVKGSKLTTQFLWFCEDCGCMTPNDLINYKKGRTILYRLDYYRSNNYRPSILRHFIYTSSRVKTDLFEGKMDYLDDFEDDLQKEIVEEALRLKAKIPYEYYYRFFTDDDNKGVYPLRKNKKLQDENEKYYASWGIIAKFGYNLLARDNMDEKSMVKYV